MTHDKVEGVRTKLAKQLGTFVSTQVSQQFQSLVKKAEETLGRRAASDQIRIQVGSATCEHAAGSNDVLDEFHKHVAASGRDDILLHQTGCTGRCSREPIVGVLVPGQMPVKYGAASTENWSTRSSPSTCSKAARYWTACSTARSRNWPSTNF